MPFTGVGQLLSKKKRIFTPRRQVEFHTHINGNFLFGFYCAQRSERQLTTVSMKWFSRPIKFSHLHKLKAYSARTDDDDDEAMRRIYKTKTKKKTEKKKKKQSPSN